MLKRVTKKLQKLSLTDVKELHTLLSAIIVENVGSHLGSAARMVHRLDEVLGEAHGSSLVGEEVYGNASSYHKIFYERYGEAFPKHSTEQSKIIRFRGKTLEIDMIDLSLKVVYEIHGQQHYEKDHFFHKSTGNKVASFNKQLAHDRLKKIWANENAYTYIEIPYLILKKDGQASTSEKLKEYIGGILWPPNCQDNQPGN